MIAFSEFAGDAVRFAGITDSADGDFSVRFLADKASLLESLTDAHLSGIHLAEQVHGADVVRVNEPARGVVLNGKADALISDVPGAALGIRVADCVPVFIYSERPRAIALVHAGREGTRLGVVRAAWERVSAEYGAEPGSARALIGPSAGPCCYEVDAETAVRCADSGLVVDGRYVNLWESIRHQLLGAGLRAAAVEVAGVCTICTTRFHSYRRSGASARNLAILAL